MKTSTLFLLIPLTLALHCLEEWFGGFPEWATRRFGAVTTRRFYFVSHIPIFIVVIVISLLAAKQDATIGTLLVALTTQMVLFANGIFHLASTVKFREYSPGVVTSVLFYFPFSGFLYYRILNDGEFSVEQFLLCLVVGAIVSCFVVFSLTWRKLF